MMLLVLLVGLAPASPARADLTFPVTGQSVWGPFESYWKLKGGLTQFGLPRSTVYSTGEGYDAQWFERALFTYNPSKPDPYKVELQLLGSLLSATRTGEAAFTRAGSSTGGMYFAETGHTLSGKFLERWRATGGLAIYGYPISEPFVERSKADGKDYTVQYFERNRFELHPEKAGTPYEVELGLLGSEMLDAMGGTQIISTLNQPAFYPASQSGVGVPPGGTVVSPGAGMPGTKPAAPPAAPALPATSKVVLFQSDFSSTNLAGWTRSTLPGDEAEAPSGWRITNGLLEQSENARESGSAEDALLILGPSGGNFADFTLDTLAYGTSGEPFGAVFRSSDAGAYIVQLYSEAPNISPKARLLLINGSQRAVLASSSTWKGYTPGRWLRLSVRAVGSELTISVNGETVISARDTSLAQGAIGLYAYADGSAKFDNVRITAP